MVVLLIFALLTAGSLQAATQRFDLVVYGGTAGGVVMYELLRKYHGLFGKPTGHGPALLNMLDA